MNAKTLRTDVLLLLTALLGAAAIPRASAAPWVAGYYTGWEQSQLPFAGVDLGAMDAVIDFAAVPTAIGTTDGGSVNEMSVGMAARVTAVHAAGKKILYAVGGVGTQAAFEGSMSSTYRATFVANLVSFMTANGYDGIDLDMEEMGTADIAPYESFATALRAAMTAAKPGSLLTAAVTWDPSAFAALNGVFDHINLETYSLSGTWYNETWHNAPVYSAAAIGGGTLASVNSMVQQFEAAGVSAAKLGVGITFDPYVWTGGSGVTAPQQTWTGAPSVSETYYSAIAKKYGLVEGTGAASGGAVYRWDASAQASYLSVSGSPTSNDAFVSYDDVSAINAKIAYANANGLGSVIIWDLAGGWRTDLPVGSRGKLLSAIKAAAYGATSSTTTPVTITTGPFTENFSSYALNACIPDGAVFGPWTSAFSGYGCDQIETSDGLDWLEQTPAVSTAAAITHASLTLGPAFAAPLTFSVNVFTKAQLRLNATPNPWEVGWVVFDYVDNAHFYSFTPQPNGWVLNKEDPAFPGNQRFLASGTSPLFPIGATYAVKIVQASNVISVSINGALITTYTDMLTPYTSGSIGFYNEDSDVRYSNVAVNVPPVVISAIAASGVSSSSATVTWTTNAIADTSVKYGPTTSYSSTTTLNPTQTQSHRVVLTGLNGGTVYHYAVSSRGISGILTTSADNTFTTLVAASTPVVVMTSPFVNNFSSSALRACFADGSTFGPWLSAFGGYGCTQVENAGSRFWLDESPAVSTAAALTHAALTLGPAFAAPITLSVQVNTSVQLRKNSAPNPWEVAWVLWDYTDQNHFYYFQAKPTGWELGKEDPAFPGSQRFLATGSTPVFPIGGWYLVKIVQKQNVITVDVNGQLITSYTDTLTPYASGQFGLYTEDAESRFADVAVDATPAAAPTVSVVVPASAASPAAAPGAGVATVVGSATILALTSNDALTSLVQFQLDGASLGAALVAPPFSLVWNSASDAAGAHTLGAIVWNAQGDSSTSAGVPLILERATPSPARSQAQAPQKFLSPGLADGINDVATFGANAAEVSIYNVRGRRVFHATSQGAPIVWNGKDGAGRIDESGVYVARIRTTDSGVVYQSFALVK